MGEEREEEKRGERRGGNSKGNERIDDVSGQSQSAEGLDRMPCWPMAADLLSLAHQTAFDTNEMWLLCP